MLAVELRPEETGSSFQNLVGPLEFSDLLLELFDLLRLGGRYSGFVTVVDVGLADPRTYRLDSIAELVSNSRDRTLLGAEFGT